MKIPVYTLLLENKKATEGNTEYFKLKSDKSHQKNPTKNPSTKHSELANWKYIREHWR